MELSQTHWPDADLSETFVSAPGAKYAVIYDGVPVCVFGVVPLFPGVGQAWLIGTDETMARTIMTVIAVALVEVGSLLAFPLAMAFGAPRTMPPPAPATITGPYTLEQAERDLLFEIARGSNLTVYDWAARWNRSVAWVSPAIRDMERRGLIQRKQSGRRKMLEIA